MSDTDRRRTRGKPWPDCLTDNQLMALLRRRLPARHGEAPDAPRMSLDDAIAVVQRFTQKARATQQAPSAPESDQGGVLPRE